jgi:hypothetical protein
MKAVSSDLLVCSVLHVENSSFTLLHCEIKKIV